MKSDLLKASVVTDDFEMEYARFGTGEKSFVILPGLSLKSVMDSAAAVKNAYKMFSERYTVYVFDRVKALPAGYSVRDMARDTAAAMNALSVRDAAVFGASMGGMIAQSLAIDHPALVGKLALGSGMARGNPTAEGLLRHWKELAGKGDVVSLNRDFFDKLYSRLFKEKYGRLIAAMENSGTKEECDRFCVQVDACLSFDETDRLGRIRCPVLVLGAKDDRVLTGEASVFLAEKTGGELHMYEDYGHAVYDEAPDYKDRLWKFFET